MKENVEILKKLAEELLSLMSTTSTVEVSFDKENEAYVVNINATAETGLLIGKKGETLSSIQKILGVMLKGKTGEWYRVVVNIGDYREKEEDYLKNLAMGAATRARETKEPQSLYNLEAWQRRIIHMYLAEEKDIVTESSGEGLERYLIIKIKSD